MTRKEKSNKQKLKKKKIIIMCFMLMCFIVFVFSLIHIIKWNIYNKENHRIQTRINKKITVEKPIDNHSRKDKYIIDFKSLKEENEDVVAYIKVPNTNIDYIIVKGKDNSFYLNHNFEKKWNSSGWLFADYKNKFDGTDKNIIIYGHNSKDGSMLGTLKNVLKKEWYENTKNNEIVLVTEKETCMYQIFSVYSIVAEEYYIKTNFKNNNEYKEFLDSIKNRSKHDFGVKLTENDTILTLSSCMPGGRSRVVLHAKKLANPT